MSLTVAVKLAGDRGWRQATVVFAVPPSQTFDVAVLQFEPPPSPTVLPFPEVTEAVKGMPVYAVGYALFTSVTDDPQLTVTSGVISSLVKHGHQNILVQTTCAVYPGHSGGAVVSQSGCIVGLTCCSVRLVSTEPHISLLVPMATLKPFLESYLLHNDVECLKGLCVRSDRVRHIWGLKSTQVPNNNLRSKL